MEKEEAKRLRESDEQPNQSAIDPTTGQFVPPPPQQPTPPTPTAAPPPLNGGDSNTPTMMNGDIKENGDTNNDDHHNDEESNTNASKEETNPSSNPNKIMLSGFVKSQYEELQLMLKSMGAEVTSQAKLATHLVMPKMCRTISFLCAMSYVKWILKPEWITDSHKEKKLLGM